MAIFKTLALEYIHGGAGVTKSIQNCKTSLSENSFRNELLADWHTDPEQEIRTGADDTKRADLVSLTQEDTRIAADIMVAAAPALGEAHGEHLSRSENAKASRYHAHAWTATLDGTTIVPVVHDAINHWLAPSALRLLHRLAVTMAQHSAPEAPAAGHSFPSSLRKHGCPSALHLLCRCMAAPCCLR